MKCSLVVDVILVFILVFGVAATQGVDSEVIELSPDIKAVQLTRSVWLYTAYTELPGYESSVPGNGLVVVSGSSAMLIDMPWSDEHTRIVAAWVKGKFGAEIEYAVPTHAHADCAGGLREANALGSESWALHKTTVKLYDLGSAIPKKSFTEKKTLYCGYLEVELMFPGAGHTDDNIVAWIPEEKVLFAGCLVKSLDAQDLGDTSEADLKAYPDTLEKLLDAYKNAEIVVPGHGSPGGVDLIKHTIELSKK
ncbi:MAG: subclass B1 metallo-beta-lactamase [Acidobacteriota bacterium]